MYLDGIDVLSALAFGEHDLAETSLSKNLDVGEIFR